MIKKKKHIHENIYTIILVIVVILGIIFRFGNLENKIVWHDETLTISRTSGYYAEEIKNEIYNGELISVEDLRKYQRKNPDRNIFSVVNILANDNPQHPPIYYLLLSFWRKFFGQSIFSIRSLSALFSTLSLFLIYLLWKELGQSALVGIISTAIVSLSPVHVLYAQEAREYSLWIFIILLSSILLIKANKLKNKFIWSAYAFVSLIGIYVFPFSLFLNIGHGIYISILEKFRFTKTSIYFILANLFVFAGFFPWSIFIINNWSENGSTWTTIPIYFSSLFTSWIKHIYNSFFLIANKNSPYIILLYIFATFISIITTYSFWLLIKKTHIDIWLFIVILACTTFIPLAGADIIFGGQRSISTRYVLPSILGLQLALSFGIAYCLKSNKILIRKITQALLIAIIFIETLSCTMIFQKNVTWNKGVSSNLPIIANEINNSNNSLLISQEFQTNSGNLLALSYLLENNISLILIKDIHQLEFIDSFNNQNFDNIFLLGVSKDFMDIIKYKYDIRVKTIFYDPYLHLQKVSN